jgi:hypothetical protein
MTRAVKLNTTAKRIVGTGSGFLGIDDTNAHSHMKTSRLAISIRSLVRTAATVLVEESITSNLLVL